MNNPFYEDGLDHKEWNNVLDKYLVENVLDSDEYERMNGYQATVIQEIKKAIKRIKAKQNENDTN